MRLASPKVAPVSIGAPSSKVPLLGTTTRLLPLTPIMSGAASPTRLPAEVSERRARTLAAGPIGSEKDPSPCETWM